MERICLPVEWCVIPPPSEHLPTVEVGCIGVMGVWGLVQPDLGSSCNGMGHSEGLDITCKELIPIILACVAWGHALSHIADDLTRNNLSYFFSKSHIPIPTHPEYLDTFWTYLNHRADWISAQWRHQFRNTFRMA